MNRQLRLLIVLTSLPYPLVDGQSLRIFHYASGLQRDCAIDLAHLGDDRPTPPALDAIFDHIHRLPADPCRPSPWWQRVRELTRPESLVPTSRALYEFLADASTQNRYDLIWAGGVRLLPSFPALRTPVLLDECDHDPLALRRLLALERRPREWLRLYRRHRLQLQLEARHAPRASAAVFVTDADRRSFQHSCPVVPAHTLANGVDSHFFTPNNRAPQSGHIVFEGAMDFEPNMRAARYLALRVMPRLRTVIPHAHLTLVGRDPTPAVQALANRFVHVTGAVEDIRPYLATAEVFVAPLHSGSGIKNKILQAWAAGVPVVASDRALEGLEAHDRENVILAYTEDGYSDAVTQLHHAPEQARRIAENARETVTRLYTWERSTRRLKSILWGLAEDSVGAALPPPPQRQEQACSFR
ncbi:glycosyltransferase family 4 protein [Halorhodospira sp. 9621]|uniref:glycosyltransferase n=1 Tax=Halorhodospira sp. 9621 TaxID=2899135 RepID=UPI001EE7AC0C|nr:glycosyltransferase [Halorhodospira sp. 9621]MCG5533874.1 glycosyltransferase family 4 protein [Halorhodospira sp. 9621]